MKGTALASIVLCLWTLLALTAPWLPLDPARIDLTHILAPPALHNWLGWDDLGRPVWERLIMGAHVSFLVAVGVVALSSTLGVIFGATTAYLGGWWDRLAVRIIDVFLAFPGILLTITLAGLLGPGIGNVIIALGTVGWVSYARITRAQVLSIKHRDHVRAAQSLGVHEMRIIFRHLLPLILSPLIIETTAGIASVITVEAGLSFLGLGVQPPAASWGSMIRDGTRYLLVAPHLVIAPGIALATVVLAVNLLGDALRDHLDVQKNRTQTSPITRKHR